MFVLFRQKENVFQEILNCFSVDLSGMTSSQMLVFTDRKSVV